MCPQAAMPVIGLPDQPEIAAGGPLARSPRESRLEAVLFLAGEPLSSRKLAQFASLADGTEARTLVRRLNRLYDAGDSAFRVEEFAGGFQLLSRSRFSRWLRRLHQSPVAARLSGPAMETLAVVAYRQPVLRAEIEAIRGVQCGEMLRQLLERDLVKIGGRSEELGRPFLYCTTKHFLRGFGLRNLDELPRAESLKAAAATHSDNNPTQNGEVNEEFQVNVPEHESEAGAIAELEDASAGPNSHASSPPAPEDERAELEDDDYEFEDDDENDDDDDEEEDDDDFDDEEWEEVDDDEFDEDDDEEDDDDDEEWDDDEEEWEEEE